MHADHTLSLADEPPPGLLRTLVRQLTALRLFTAARTRVLAYLVLGLWSAASVACLLWIVLASLKSTRDLFRHPWSWPEVPQWGNYLKAWLGNHFSDYFLNSLLVTTVAVAGLLMVCVPAAYVLARARFAGRESLTSLFVLGMGVPVPLLFVPLVVLVTSLRLGDTLTGLTLVYIALSIPFTVYVLLGFFGSLPSEVEAAAVMDGCSDWQVFRHVMLPMAMPGVATAAILNFIGLWNEYQLSLVLINSPDNRTLSLGIYSMISSMQYSGGDWPTLFAGVSIVMAPTLVIYALMSEHMIGGITMGAVK